MAPEDTGAALRNLDRRMDRVEQFLPTLATKDELQEAVARLATKDELQEAVAKLATKDELQEAVAKLATKDELQEAVAKLATKDELNQVKEDLEEKIKAEGATSRRYMKVLTEEVKTEIRLFTEKVDAVDQRDARQHADTIKRETALDKRVTALEASGSRRRR